MAGLFAKLFPKWRPNLWLEAGDATVPQLLVEMVVCLAILFFTFPFGLIICVVLFAVDIIKGHDNPVHAGHGEIKRVAIIGCGVSGITSAKAMIEEGHEVVMFDKDHQFGGVWQFSAQNRGSNRQQFSGQVWQNLITTSSAYVTSFSDFVPQQEFVETKEHPYHMTADMYYDYLSAYMRYGQVDEKKHMRLSTTVRAMNRNGAKWDLTIETKDGKSSNEQFDWVIISTGQHQVGKDEDEYGKAKQLSEFKGMVLHSQNYINPAPFVGKRVLIVGGGDSGADIVKHIADLCKPGECYMSLRHGAHVAPRYFYGDSLPIDYAMFRFAYYLPHVFRTNILREAFNKVMYQVTDECKTSQQIMRLHELNGLSASTYFTTKSEEMCKAFAAGLAHLKPEVKRFTATGVDFEVPNPNIAKVDTSSVEVDAVILCTGFRTVYPFLPEQFRTHEHLDRYRHVFLPELEQVAFVGFARPAGFGAIPPCAEIQARWVAQVVSGTVDLPSNDSMKATQARFKKEYKAIRKTPNQTLIFFPYYLAEIANEFGANPHLWAILLKSPKLWFRIMFGAYTSHQYRLSGPHAKFDWAQDHLVNKMSFPNPKNGPVQRPPVPVVLLASAFFGVLSKVPYFGQNFSPCI